MWFCYFYICLIYFIIYYYIYIYIYKGCVHDSVSTSFSLQYLCGRLQVLMRVGIGDSSLVIWVYLFTDHVTVLLESIAVRSSLCTLRSRLHATHFCTIGPNMFFCRPPESEKSIKVSFCCFCHTFSSSFYSCCRLFLAEANPAPGNSLKKLQKNLEKLEL